MKVHNMDRIRRAWRSDIAIAVLVLLLALYVWPNVVHEPMHWLALQAQGSGGTVSFDWTHYPAQPSTTRTAPVAGVTGGLLFVLAPSLLSILLIVWMGERAAKRKALVWELGLTGYLVMDILINIMQYRTAISDFAFLHALPGLDLLLEATLCGYIAWVAWRYGHMQQQGAQRLHTDQHAQSTQRVEGTR